MSEIVFGCAMENTRIIPPSELVINDDGTIFHLHLHPGQIADTVLLVGDPARVDMIAKRFTDIECRVVNREFVTVTGKYHGKRISAMSTGIGVGAIDIVATELDALVNIDFGKRQIKDELTKLTLLRLGTTGALQPDIELGQMIYSRTTIGFDGLLGYYAGRNEVCDLEMERAFVEHTGWLDVMPRPYCVDSSEKLNTMFRDITIDGITISSPGFYAPQGRYVRLMPASPELNKKIASFRYDGRRITNYEMESSVLVSLGRLLGHDAATICVPIAQRSVHDMRTDYHSFIEAMIDTVLDRITQ